METPVPRLFTTAELAARLGLRPTTLRAWRGDGRGPPYVRLSASRVGYRPADVESWLERRAWTSVSAEAAGRDL